MEEVRAEVQGCDQITTLADRWPDWRIWRSRTGELVCATRRRPLHPPTHGLSATIIADTVAELDDALTREALREAGA